MRRIPLLLCLAFVLTGSSAAQTQVGFLAAGDYGVGGSREQALGQRMQRFEARHPANMLVTLGDNDYLESPSLFRANWQKAFGWARRSGLRVGGVLGNHDYELGRGAYELTTLGMPGRYYTRKLGDVQLFFLDSNAITTRQTRWLEQQLPESTATWKVALFHHPPYTCGGHAGDTDVVRQLGAALRELRRPARPLGARPQLPALRAAERRHVRRPRRRRALRSIGCTAVRARIRRGCGDSPSTASSTSLRPTTTRRVRGDLRGRVADHFALTP